MSDFALGLALIYLIAPAAIGIYGMILYKLMALTTRTDQRVKISLIIALCLLSAFVLLGFLGGSFNNVWPGMASGLIFFTILALGLTTTFPPFGEYLGFRGHEACIFPCSMVAVAPVIFMTAAISVLLYSRLDAADTTGPSITWWPPSRHSACMRDY